MKKSTKQQPKGNTLFNYFSKTQKKKEVALSDVIAKHSPTKIDELKNTTAKIGRTFTSNIVEASNKTALKSMVANRTISLDSQNSESKVIDLTMDDSSSQSSFHSSSSFHTDSHVSTMTNPSKFNKKAWAPIESQRGPLRSSQEYRPSPQKVQPNKIKVHVQSAARPTYDWLGENDVKPYSSNYTPYKSPATGSKPRILPYSMKRDRLEDDQKPMFSKRGFKDQWPSTKRGGSGKGPVPTINAPSTMYRPTLSAEQQSVLDMVLRDKRSLFFTGSAGTGKSVLLRAIIDEMESIYGAGLAVTASTGIAAININGCTLHSFGGIGIGDESAEKLIEKIKYENRKAQDRWRKTDVLIIDEISMVDAELFDKLDQIAKALRNSSAPFGGMQVIVSGDFFQLPPVNPSRATKFAFEAKSWQAVITQTVMLTQIFRQKDGTFASILNEMRLGRLSQNAIEIFKSLSRKPKGSNEIEPTELYPLRREVDLSNNLRLNALKGEVVEFKAIDKGDKRKVAQCIAPEVMQLKLHAQVMLLKNYDIDLVNGSLGVVVGFVGQGHYKTENVVQYLRAPQRQKDTFAEGGNRLDMGTPFPVVRFAGGRELVLEYETWSFDLPGGQTLASRSQLPLMLAWAISIHKSQGQTLDRVKVDLGKVFEKGQAYVALSRATSLERLQILNFDPSKVMAHPRVTEFYKTLQTLN